MDLASSSAIAVVATSATLVLGACGSDDGTTRLPRGTAGTTSGASQDGGAGEGSGPAEDSGGSTPPGAEESGEATYYNAEGKGACGIQTPADYLVAAINDEQYSKANCGKCLSVKGPKGIVVVRIIDKCPGCGPGDLDLSVTAFTTIADKSAGRVKITWRFVDCP